MPFVFGPETFWRRPIKRRKITESLAMARYRPENEQTSPDPEQRDDQYAATDTQPAPRDSSEEAEIRTSDREELIQCIKRGQRPTWVPKPNLEALCAEANAQAEGRVSSVSKQPQEDVWMEEAKPEAEQARPSTPISHATPRPPSALHTGDFHESSSAYGSPLQIPPRMNPNSASPPVPDADSPAHWIPPSLFGRFQRHTSDPAAFDPIPLDIRQRSRAPSLGSSLSSSFVMRAPTSPLVNAVNNPSLDFSEVHPPPRPQNRADRRKTLPSPMTSALQFSSLESSPSITPPSFRREATVPRNHQPRRSLTSFTYQPAPSASTVYPSRQRRLSHASETSPRQRTSMVGSFEESIIRGRMSTAPSKPLEFVAKIGVMGKGKCPEKLKCPAHVTVPFPAVFYSYPSTSGPRTISDDSPSPYVGTIDLQHNLIAPEQMPRKKQRPSLSDANAMTAERIQPQDTSISEGRAADNTAKGTHTRKSAIGGAYRVPQQGQLQIIVKNPNNTAVKLFLVPYDLDGMQPGTKTFVRQRSFSTGPILENVLSDKPIQDPLSGKHVLRYLIHLKFCCLGKGRFYLYDGVKIVFANRVPDGKEKLRNEVQIPEPKFSALVLRNSQPNSRSQSGAEGFLPSPSPSPSPVLASPQLDMMDGLVHSSSPVSFSSPQLLFHTQQKQTQILHQEVSPAEVPQTSNGSSSHGSRPTSPEVHGFLRSSISQRGSPVPWGTAMDLQPRSPSPVFNGDGLLSRKLRELGRQTAKTSLDDNRDIDHKEV
ncbi:uncharacterized protein HMPREF1541_07263 [Cyphellophora europaea CBS 101466]|uniref:Atos-like conserved domain-containing protein n=1 Tax=Cyphellophora europaea (strain CBS 101466) TaxID=1220924 RepID=W2RMT4_CYPE1|nr:uncharacterized protein HMPREF1541_07263 [Cyphellophora europaea CBS 101466]ETN37640.1 hypothetical protein HMPREF1541_07263 [Cyphellophora europaea CBS 101466]